MDTSHSWKQRSWEEIHVWSAGAVALSELSSMGAIVNCSFHSNTATMAAGSAVSIISNNLFTVFGTNFTSNLGSPSQGHPGGALFHSSQDSGALTLLISRSSFLGNFGGAVSAVGSYIIINATSFMNNVGGMQAGAITCESCVRLLLQSCEVEGSVSNSPGGAIQTTGQSASGVLLDQVIASNNRWVAFLMQLYLHHWLVVPWHCGLAAKLCLSQDSRPSACQMLCHMSSCLWA